MRLTKIYIFNAALVIWLGERVFLIIKDTYFDCVYCPAFGTCFASFPKKSAVLIFYRISNRM